jgi:endo-1,4-beta-xylanase
MKDVTTVIKTHSRRQFVSALLSGYINNQEYASGGSARFHDDLRARVQRSGKYLGCSVARSTFNNPVLLGFIQNNFNTITPAVELKWGALRPSPAEFNFTNSDWMVAFAERRDIAIHGHNLCWNTANPDWFRTVINKSNATSFLKEHIETVMNRYKGRIDSWDVVNEPVLIGGRRPDGLYPGVWLSLIGPEYIDIAFETAAVADPKALRVLNLHHVEQDGTDEFARQASLTLVRQLVRRKIPIQGVGFESHLNGSRPTILAERDIFISRIRDLGLEVLVTELDVSDTNINGDLRSRDTVVGECYRSYLENIIKVASPRRIGLWTIADLNNWYDAVQDPSFKRADGAHHRPGLLDEKLQPKSVYDAFRAGLEGWC